MIEVMPESEGKVLAVKATGKLTNDDYGDVLVPKMDEILAAHGGVRLLLYMDDEFEGWAGGAVWADAKLGVQQASTALRGGFEKIALAGRPGWIGKGAELAGYLMHGEIKAFRQDERDEAIGGHVVTSVAPLFPRIHIGRADMRVPGEAITCC